MQCLNGVTTTTDSIRDGVMTTTDSIRDGVTTTTESIRDAGCSHNLAAAKGAGGIFDVQL